jgi:hypothetical protein
LSEDVDVGGANRAGVGAWGVKWGETKICKKLEKRIKPQFGSLARIFHSHIGKSREKPYEKRGANTFECVVETTRHAGLETCDTAGWEACATMVCHGFAGFTMKYPG